MVVAGFITENADVWLTGRDALQIPGIRECQGALPDPSAIAQVAGHPAASSFAFRRIAAAGFGFL